LYVTSSGTTATMGPMPAVAGEGGAFGASARIRISEFGTYPLGTTLKGSLGFWTTVPPARSDSGIATTSSKSGSVASMIASSLRRVLSA